LKKVLFCLIFLLFVSFVSAEEIVKTPTLIEPSTKIVDDRAYINHSVGYVEQYPSTITKDGTARITFKNNIKWDTFDVCMDFPVHNSLITFDYVKRKAFLFDENLQQEYRSGNRICFKQFTNKENEQQNIDFKPNYNGDGMIKYNVTILPSIYNKSYASARNSSQLIVLDPYLIGDLSTDDVLLAYFPFNNNLESVFGQQINAISESDTRYNGSESSTSSSGTCSNPTNVYDGSYATKGGGSNCEYFINFAKLENDTGMKLELKVYGSEGLHSSGGELRGDVWMNETVPDDCFNTYSDNVNFKYITTSGTTWSVYVYCDDGATWDLIGASSGWAPNAGNAEIYDSAVYITNESGYTAYSNTSLNASYRIEGTAGYDFKFEQNSNDVFNSYDGTDTNITYNDDGAVFNGTDSIITLNNQLTEVCDDGCTFCVRTLDITEDANFQTFIARYSPTNDDRFIRFTKWDESNRVYFGIYNDGTGDSGKTSYVAYSGVDFSEDNFICGVFNGSTSVAGHTILYLNGEQVAVSSGVGVTTTTINSTAWNDDEDILIGAIRTGSPLYLFNGTMDKAYIYNRTLTPNEISALYNNGSYTTNLISEANTSLDFNDNDYVVINDTNSDLDFEAATDDFSVSVWVNTSDTSFKPILNYNDGNNDGWSMGLSSQKMYTEFDFDNDIGTVTVNTNEWTHLVYVVDRDTGVSFYVNGVFDKTGTTMKDEVLAITSNNLMIGRHYNNVKYFNGSMDELMIFNKSLSSTEVIQLYGGYNNSINFSVYDARTNDLITSESVTIDLYNEVRNWSDTVTTNNGYVSANGIPSGNLRIHAYSDSYDASINVKSISGTNDALTESIFLTNSSDTNIKDVLLSVTDEVNNKLENATVRVWKFNASEGSYTQVIEKTTNINGESLVTLVKDDVFYKFTILYTGVKCYETVNPFTISGSDDEIGFICIVADTYNDDKAIYDDISVYLNCTNSTNISGACSLEANTTFAGEVCLEIRRLTNINQGYVSINETCTNTTTFLATHAINATGQTRDTTYRALAKFTPVNQSIQKVVDTYHITFKITSTPDFGNLGLYMTYLIMLLVFLAFIKTPVISIIASGGVFFIATITPLVNLSSMAKTDIGSGIVIFVIAIILAFIIQSKREE
tara:strand:- start:6883 stop:10296 length:3414 start_codon:yes stop_codon:yes gene_type:complete